MKTRLFLVLLTLHTVLHAAPPPITFTIDPDEPLNGSVVYTRVGAETAAAGDKAKLWFALTITNTSANQVTVNNIRATLNTGEVWNFARDVDVPALTVGIFELTKAEIITLPQIVPGLLTISVFCNTFTDPKSVQRILIPYTPTTQGSRYLFPADEGDIGPDEYFSGGTHMPPDGQRWGTDWKVFRIPSAGDPTTVRVFSDGSQNEDHLGFGVPIRTIAEGVVLRVTDGRMDSPETGKRPFQELQDFDGEAISDVKVKFLGKLGTLDVPGVSPFGQENRSAVIVRRADGRFTVTIWDVASGGRDLIQRGSITSDFTVSDIAIEALSLTRIVVSVRRAIGGAHQLLLYDVPADETGLPVLLNVWDGDSGHRELSLARLADEVFVSGVRDASGNLRVDIFTADSDVIAFDNSSQTAGAASSICTTPVGVAQDGEIAGQRFATSVRADGGGLKVIVWDWFPTLNPRLRRRGEALATNISRVAATSNAGSKWITATRTSPGGFLQLARWSASADGMTLTPEMVTTTEHTIENTALDVVHGWGNSTGQLHAATTSVIGGGLKMNGWGDHSDTTFGADAQSTEATFPMTHVSIDELPKMVFLVAARTAAGTLRLTTWDWAQGGGNFAIIRHGNCRVLYAHLKLGSVDEGGLKAGDTVSAGQFIGRMGNSGSAGTPHTHVHADRLQDGFTDAQLIALEAEFNYTGVGSVIPTLTARPMPFSDARAMKIDDIVRGGETSNDLATMTSHVMLDVDLGIRPRLNTRYVVHGLANIAPNGRKDMLPNLNGGPFREVIPALPVVPSGGRLYIRGGSYDETMIFSTPMTVRRYDYYERLYETNLPVIIGK